MKPATITYLTQLNQITYDQKADHFSLTREKPWSGWDRLTLPTTPPLKVLDLGCGNGRFYSYLTTKLASNKINYLGLDSSSHLIAIAQSHHPSTQFSLICPTDLTKKSLPAQISTQKYDLITCFGLFHHLPGQTNRQNLINQLLALLTPKGQLILTFWQFADQSQLKKKIIPKNRLNMPKTILSDLEPHDHFIAFGDKTSSPLYAHHFSDAEIEKIIYHLPGHTTTQFKSDYDHTNHYLVFSKE